jgi:phosphoglycolate phosphatase-like HAD superfamily hydrolase
VRCSECSAVVKPIVAIDIDGTMGDYHGSFMRFAEQYVGRTWSGPVYNGGGSFREWVCWNLKITASEYRQMKLAYRQGANKRFMPILPHALELCLAVRAAGAELWVTTTRPYLSLDNVVPDTVEWLRRQGIEYDGMLFDDDKYLKLAEQIDAERVVAVFDDIQENVFRANELFQGNGWLVKGAWNRFPIAPNMCSLSSAQKIAVNAIEEWRESYDG